MVGYGQITTVFHNVLQRDQEKKDSEKGNMPLRLQETNSNYQLSY